MFAKVNVALVLGFVLVACAFAKSNAGDCESDADNQDKNQCTPKFSSFMYHSTSSVSETLSFEKPSALQRYTSQLVDKSFNFLIMSSAFNKHDLDRPGFEKLYRKISDKAWEDAIDLIKYQSRRGSFAPLVKPGRDANYTKAFEAKELTSLQFALDYEKEMAKEAHEIHRSVSHAAHSKSGSSDHYDPDAAHYLDENIIEYQSGVLRDLAGYIHNLKHFSSDNLNGDLGNHLFDEYLEKAL